MRFPIGNPCCEYWPKQIIRRYFCIELTHKPFNHGLVNACGGDDICGDLRTPLCRGLSFLHHFSSMGISNTYL
tara:strand:- start:1896 stop:2114 length:219 start_codon:yes stop_codon:yes gene_type:complete